MFFTIIVPFLNEEKYLQRCLESLVRQDFRGGDYEILLIDNGSSDQSLEIVSHYPQIRLLHQKNKGAYAARNLGLSAARGNIVAFTDADCAVSPDWLSRIAEGMRDPGVSMAVGRRLFAPDVSKWLRAFEVYENAKASYVFARGRARYYYGYTNNMAVRRELFEKIGLFQLWERAGDTEFVHRCLKQNPEIRMVYLDQMRVTHLEIRGVGEWLRRLRLYGSSNEQVRKHFNYEKLGALDEWRIFQSCRTVWENQAGVFFAVLLLFMAGEIAYQTGRFDTKNRPARSEGGQTGP